VISTTDLERFFEIRQTKRNFEAIAKTPKEIQKAIKKEKELKINFENDSFTEDSSGDDTSSSCSSSTSDSSEEEAEQKPRKIQRKN
jgi:outer membrane protein assembly factor BamE (lipoprotein component of BamABCDE complex)